MINKRFSLKYIDEEHISANIYDNGTFIASVSIGEELLVEVLNQVVEENEQLKIQLNNTSAQRNEFHRAVRENANRVGVLEKKNEELKKVAKEFAENQTQHNLWKLRYVLKNGDVE